MRGYGDGDELNKLILQAQAQADQGKYEGARDEEGLRCGYGV